ncbi:ATP-binding protein [Mucilaginibacter sp. OK283]|uniref:ATP-binding protein n=1 Tax=Mucilaginibacter sp. OK283 TaxID=1881049 RepID=UPI0008D576D2|nr:ATP-binding protein [Mucilaginibacter sp. OK283]SEO12234.1 ATPase family associated with various cellular activities (AAA) [Mucilaginibacter sp. OK283]
MIHQLKKITPPGLETAIKLCRDLVSERVQAHFNNIPFDVVKWYDQHGYQLSNDPLAIIPDINDHEAWVTVMITLIPHVQPNFFESVILEHLPNGGDFPEIGGVKATNHRSMLPTGETLQFILAGTNVTQRVRLQQLFSQEHFFHRQGIIWLENVKEGEPMMSGRIILNPEWVDKILLGKESPPRFGPDFPAKKIETGIQWDDVVLHPRTMNQINDIRVWLLHHDKFNSDANLKVKIKPGYRVLFYGPPGTGKTLTAALLGKEYDKDVYRIDLSQIVSKYIGETEKNLENVFRKAETKDWILFFDEADALFGKRTNVQSAHDKYANQEVSYLLQRVEDFPGLMILASNFKNNLDDAFLRRFHSVVHFPMPNATERQNLWNKTLPAGLKLDASINLKELAEQFELTGASILSAVHYATLQSYEREDGILFHTDLIDGIRKEFLKEEKSIDS